jgi:hypothetical protein
LRRREGEIVCLIKIGSWSAALQTWIGNALNLLLAAAPQILAFLVLLGVGWLIASILGGMVIAVLSRARFSDWVHRSGVGAALGDIGIEPHARVLRAIDALVLKAPSG